MFATLDDILIKFVPKCDGSELWPWKPGKRTEIEAIYSQGDTMDKKGRKKASRRLRAEKSSILKYNQTTKEIRRLGCSESANGGMS